jgi:hypothetical protein
VALEQLPARRAWITFNRTPYTEQGEVDYLTQLLSSRPHRLIEENGNSTLYLVELKP